MSATTLVWFWVFWLLDVLITLYGYNEFMGGLFGRRAAPSTKYKILWISLLGALLVVVGGSLFLKNQGAVLLAMIVAVIPLVVALPYVLFLAVVLMSGPKNWR